MDNVNSQLIKQYELASTIIKLRSYLEANNYKTYRLSIAPSNYFDLSYEERRDLLNAPNISYLCKTIVMENDVYDNKYADKYYYPKFILVLVQYVSKINGEKITKYFKNLQNEKCLQKAGRGRFHFRLVPDNVAFQLTGYPFNGITPFCTTENLPLLISDSIQALNEGYLYFGGGHGDLKLRITLDEIIAKYPAKVFLTDITQDDQCQKIQQQK